MRRAVVRIPRLGASSAGPARPRSAAPAGPPACEDDFLSRVLAEAAAQGWRSAHFRPARTRRGYRTPVQGDGAGFPDLVLIHAARGVLLVAELKMRGKYPSAAQRAWLDAFRAVGTTVHVWRPNDWPEIVAVLRGTNDQA